MDENEIFDPSLKKKKKKKKTPFDLDAALGEDSGAQATEEQTDEAAKDAAADGEQNHTDVLEDISLELGAKKKKKKKTTFNMDELEESLPTKDESEEPEKSISADFTGDLDFSNLGKKKKKKKVVIEAGAEEKEEQPGKAMEDAMAEKDSDRDYTYDELLKRVFDIMKEKNPEMVSGEKKRFVMKPPQVMRAGAKKVAFTNFADICKMLHRQPKHFMAFLLAELGTSGSIDGSNQLIIKGKFQQKQVENVLRHYIKEYVTCHTCKSPETILQRDTRLYFLQCETCGSRCSVASIKSGFQAVTGKRAAMRAKTA